MEKQVNETFISYTAEDETIYVISPLTSIAGVIGITGMPSKLKSDLKHIWKDSGVLKLILFCPADEKSYIKACRGAGFKQEGRLKNAMPEGDLLVFGQYR